VRRRLVAGAAGAACLVVAACGGATSHQASHPATTATVATHAATTSALTVPATTTPATAPVAQPKPKPKADPGKLPQTDQLPSAGTAQFHAEMAALWSGVTQNSLQAALPAFFPEAAYVQVKGIADPQADFTDRLVADYQLDLSAAHGLLGAQPQSARLVAVQVPQSYAHWVDPGACYNTVGYYEVPNARVVYRQNGAVRSFGIASMISWRGVWYVVHLGAVLRPSAAGVVDDPSSGTGVSAPSSTC
jgi:hypothetical protein